MFGYNGLKRELKSIKALAQSQVMSTITNNINQQLNSVNYYPSYNAAGITNLYATSDQVYAVVNKIAETSALVPIYTYQTKDAKSLKKLKSLTNRQFYSTKGIFDINVVRTKALDDNEDNDLTKLLDKPNDYQGRADFFQAAYTYYLMDGECIIWIDKTDNGANEGKPYQLHIFPAANVSINVTKEFPQTVTGYNVSINGLPVLKNIPPEDIIHWKRLTLKFGVNGEQFRGMSPLAPATNLTARLQESDLRSLSQLKNGSVPGIVYDKTLGGDEIEQPVFDAQKKAFYDFAKNPANQGAPFFVGSQKGFLQTGLSAADLKLIELQGIDFKRLCNIYKVSDVLFNSDAASTESNVQEQVKQMYTSACLPMVYSFNHVLNNKLVPYYDDVDYTDADISSITELQDDVKLMLQALSYLPITPTGNEFRRLLNYDDIDLPWMNEPTIKQGYAFYDDTVIPPVNPDLLDTGI